MQILSKYSPVVVPCYLFTLFMMILALLLFGPDLSISYKDSFPFRGNWIPVSATGTINQVDLISVPGGKGAAVYRYVFTFPRTENSDFPSCEGVSYTRCSRTSPFPRYQVGEQVSLAACKTNDSTIFYKIKGGSCSCISGYNDCLLCILLLVFTFIPFFVLWSGYEMPWLGYQKKKRYNYKRRFICILSVWICLVTSLCLTVFLSFIFSESGSMRESFLFNNRWVDGGHGKIVKVEPKDQLILYHYEWYESSDTTNSNKLHGLSYSFGKESALYQLNDEVDVLIYNNDRFSGNKLPHTSGTDQRPCWRRSVFTSVFVSPLIILFSIFVLSKPEKRV